ncbi:tetratricopeptide repeat protein [Herbiconiux moechotypicola]|uniref:Tetratricopeptide repeat protein n=1 Tax=Herbiconiux moechotypicola TaxID=637393 RepID=A0ABN3E1N6_9MICO|nr:tetratricopeptide repeat protein [Herbiconiux moechotypicola]MCS5731332.1 tetratricopeptide repeat protein [Herbiconiux moechotypicola]
MSDDWFRGPEWDADTRDLFESKLRRALRSNRQQYLRIKALGLLGGGRESDAVELFHRSIAEGTYFFQTVSAWESLGEIAAHRGDREEAIKYFRKVIIEQPSLSGTSGATEISLAEVLLDSGRPNDLDESRALLDSWMSRDQLKFNSTLFRWHLAQIRIAERVGDRNAARSLALKALELAASGPQLPRHKDVGLVKVEKATLRHLKHLSR